MTGNQKKGIVICALSYPIAYILGILLYHITAIFDAMFPGIIIVAVSQLTIIPITIIFNVIAVIVAFGHHNPA